MSFDIQWGDMEEQRIQYFTPDALLITCDKKKIPVHIDEVPDLVAKLSALYREHRDGLDE